MSAAANDRRGPSRGAAEDGAAPVGEADEPRVAVLGAGAMGSLFGGMLCAVLDDVWLVDIREDHIAAVARDGLVIESAAGTRRVHPKATTDRAEPGPVDLLLVFVKATRTAAAVGGAGPLIGPRTVVLTLQNGLGNLEAIAAVVGEERTLGGATYQGARTLGLGRISHHIVGETRIGALSKTTEARARAIVELFERAGLPTRFADDVSSLVWTKAVNSIAVNALTAITGLTFAEVVSTPPALQLLRRLLEECLSVTRALGIELDLGPDPAARLEAHLVRIGPTKSSMLQDFELDRESEVDALNGALVRYGERLGIRTPYNEAIFRVVEAIERRRGV